MGSDVALDSAKPIAPSADGSAAVDGRLADWLRRVAEIGPGLAARAALNDQAAGFAVEDFADLRRSGLLGLCVPVEDGGLGAGMEAFMRVAAELGRFSGATALGFSMHATQSLWTGPVMAALGLPAADAQAHRSRLVDHNTAIVQQGRLCAQAISEPGAASAGVAPFATQARVVDGGWRVSGHKVFVSMAGHADVYGVLCTEIGGHGLCGSRADTLFLRVPADAPGLRVEGAWDPLGMRATVSRGLRLDEVFVPAGALLLPRGAWHLAAGRFPHMLAMLMPAYMGQAQAAYDFTVDYLLGRVPGMAPVQRRMYPTKQAAVAQMRVQLEGMRALFLQTAREARIDPDHDARMRLYAAQYTVMEGAHDLCRLALRTCGGQAMMRSFPLERLFRDTRCGALMLPLTAELCLERLGHECLYQGPMDDEVIE
ncbi:MAG: acyl-CoA dehydrogenase family protein [Aquabacterium sp.]